MPLGEQPLNADPDSSEAPPFLKTWPRLYAAVLVYLSILLAVLYALTKAFHY